LISVNKSVHSTFDFSPPIFNYPVIPWVSEWITNISKVYPQIRESVELVSALHDGLVSTNNIYLLKSPGGRYLLKIKDVRCEDEISTLEELIEYLNSRDAGAICPLPDNIGRRFSRLPEGRAVELFPFVEGYYYTGRTDDLLALGGALAGLHRVLAKIPISLMEKMAVNSFHRESRWRKCLETIAHGEYSNKNDQLNIWLQENKNYVDRMLKGWRPSTDLPGKPLPIHGDLNRGNVLFSSDNSNVYFLDFEDAAFALMPLYMELGFVLQRFVFYDDPKYEITARRLEAFFKAYGPVHFELPFAEVLRLWSYRNTVRIVCRLQALKGHFDKIEMDKFIQLERQAEICEAQMVKALKI